MPGYLSLFRFHFHELHDGPIVQNGFIEVPTKPGLGIELNRDVVEAHLAEGETWWG